MPPSNRLRRRPLRLCGDQLRGDGAGVAEAWTATRDLRRSMPRWRAASDDRVDGACAVASLRPRDPPERNGFARHDGRDVYPTFIEYVSIIQAIVWRWY